MKRSRVDPWFCWHRGARLAPDGSWWCPSCRTTRKFAWPIMPEPLAQASEGLSHTSEATAEDE